MQPAPPPGPGAASSRDRGRTVAPAALVEALAGCGIPLVTDPAVLAGHCVDWTGQWSGPALGMVRPRSTDGVARVLAAARGAGVPVQVQGGNTGLVGGSVPADPALLLVTTGLDRIGAVDVLERSVVTGAGVTAATVAAHAQASGLEFGVDLAARDSATIGGMAATNAGGIGVSAYGMMREQVRGITAVLPDGRTIRTTGRPRKDNAGYDLTGLLVGSEGTLAVITEVELALHPRPPRSTVALLAVGDLAAAVRAARAVQAATRLLAAEVVDAAGVARASRALGLPDPLAGRTPWLLLLEVADSGTGEGLAPVAGDVVAVAVEPGDRARLWAYRERQTELYAALPGATEKLDVSVRLDQLDGAVAAIRELAAAAGGAAGAVGVFGHALDGNLHVQLVGADPGLAAAALRRVASLGGAISAEHGIGRLKAGLLDLARSPEEIAWMRAIKDRLDPGGLLNPGVLLEH